MDYIWSVEHPVTTAEIIQNLPEGKKWKQNTLITFLTRLIEKGVLKATRTGRTNLYEPCITEKEYRSLETRQFIKDVHRGSIFGFINTLFDNGDLTKEEIEDLMKRLKE